MYHSGIGGGGFMLVRGSNGSYEFIDFRETAPAAAFQDMYKGNINGSLFGGLARYFNLSNCCPFCTIFLCTVSFAEKRQIPFRLHDTLLQILAWSSSLINLDSPWLPSDELLLIIELIH